MPVPPSRPSPAAWLLRPLAAVLAALLAFGALLLGGAGAAQAANNGTWAVFPTPPAGTATPGPSDRQYFYLESAPGRTISDRVSVVNLTDKPMAFQFYGADAYNTPRDGGFALRTAGQPMTGVGRWLTLNTQQLTVPARTRADIPFTLAIPATAEPGDHPGAIVAVETGTEATTQQGGMAVGIKRAVGARIYLHVSGTSVPALSVDSVSVQRTAPLLPGLGASKGTLHFTLTNHGNATLHPRVEISESGWFGSVYHRAPTDTGIELLPGQSVQLTLALPSPPQFDDVSVTVKASDGATSAVGSGGYLAMPWLVVGVVVLLLAGAGWWFWRRAKRRRIHRGGRRWTREPVEAAA
ncbi:hypothetical protein ABIA32_001280 [Streptacidiphilus sp. MAP12-20]|uniref:DUF916 domain-containing protein n=1 Tax=Streptacidiphilus sp. MAP12-20 TaxID=3156299 RepID=UPI003512E4A4